MSSNKDSKKSKKHDENPMKAFFKHYLWIQGLFWTLVPYFTLRVLPLDTLEAILWGQGVSFGNAKHPPLSGWIAGIVSFFTHRSDWGYYLLSQICVLIGLWYIYRIARFFFSVEKSVIAVLLQTLIAYYNFTSPEFNVNVLTLALWPLFVYYFIKGKHDGKWYHWMYCGLYAGLNLLTKYTFVLLCIALVVYLICEIVYSKRLEEHKKNLFLSPWPYCAVLLALLIASPHFFWVFKNDFRTLLYAESRMAAVAQESFLSQHVLAPLTFLLEAVLPLLALVFSLMICSRKIRIFALPQTEHGTRALHLALSVFAVPIVVIFFMAVFGCHIRSMWLSSLYSTAGLLFVALLKDEPDAVFLRNIRIIVCIVFVSFLATFAVRNLTHTTNRGNLPAEQYAAQWEDLYRKANPDGGFKFVVGDIWHAGVMHHYAPSHPVGCIYNDICEMKRWNVWLTKSDVFLLSDNADDITASEKELERQPETGKITKTEYTFRALFGDDRTEKLYYSVLKAKGQNG